MQNIFQFTLKEFTHVAPILACAVFGIVIIVERLRVLVWIYAFPQVEAFFDKIRYLVLADRIGEAISLCEYFHQKPVAQVVKQALLRAHQPEKLIENGLQVAVGEATERTSLRTGFLATIANVATLFGLFGTIIGLVQSFEAVGSANAAERAALLAAGISTAMNATMLGLGVAIPCMIAYSYLMSCTNRLNSQIDRFAIKILEILEQRYYSTEAEPPPVSRNPEGRSRKAKAA